MCVNEEIINYPRCAQKGFTFISSVRKELRHDFVLTDDVVREVYDDAP